MSDPVAPIQPAAEKASDKAYEIVAELIDTRCEDGAFLTAWTLRSFSDAVVAAVWPLAVTQTRQDIAAGLPNRLLDSDPSFIADSKMRYCFAAGWNDALDRVREDLARESAVAS